jgi:hypothetical protein
MPAANRATISLPQAAVAVVAGMALLCVVSAHAAGPAVPASQPAADPALVATFEAIALRLGSDSPQIRDAASEELESLPPEALPLIEKAIAEGDYFPEIERRLSAKVSLLRHRSVATAFQRQQLQAARWVRDDALASYSAGRHTNPKWDGLAQTAITLAVSRSSPSGRTVREKARLLKTFAEVERSGCDDPFILFLSQCIAIENGDISNAEAFQKIGPLTDRVLSGPYSAHVKLVALSYRARRRVEAETNRLSPASRDAIRLDLSGAELELAATLKIPGYPALLAADAAAQLLQLRFQTSEEPTETAARLSEMLHDAYPHAATSFTFAARAHLHAAELGRNAQLDLNQRNARASHLKQAAELLDAGYRADPSDPAPATLMLRLANIQGMNGGEADWWFAEAMKANPGNFAACSYRLQYFVRYASMEKAIDFARQCRAGGDWHSRIPFILVDAHLMAGNYSRSDTMNEYVAADGPWNDIADVYENYLRRYPDAAWDRSMYANFAARTHHWEIARQQLAMLGDAAIIDCFNGPDDFAYLKRKVEQQGR